MKRVLPLGLLARRGRAGRIALTTLLLQGAAAAGVLALGAGAAPAADPPSSDTPQAPAAAAPAAPTAAPAAAEPKKTSETPASSQKSSPAAEAPAGAPAAAKPAEAKEAPAGAPPSAKPAEAKEAPAGGPPSAKPAEAKEAPAAAPAAQQPAEAKGGAPLGGSLLSGPPAEQPAGEKGGSPLGGGLLGGPAAPGNAPSTSSSVIFTPGAPPPPPAPPPPTEAGPTGATGAANELTQYRDLADKLYKATSGDAETFKQAIGNPDLRRRLEQTLKIPLTDEKLQAMAAQAGAEAAYWQAYQRGIAQQMQAGKQGPEEEMPAVAAQLPFWGIGTFNPAGAEPPGESPPPSGDLLASIFNAVFPLGERTPMPGVSDVPHPLLKTGTLPLRPAPLLEVGNGFLSTGPLSEGFELPGGAMWQPRLWVFGQMRSAVQSFYDGKTHFSEWVNRLDLFGNLQLTGTERLVVGLQPLNHDASGQFAGYRFGPRGRATNFTNANVRTLFFEGDFGSTFPNLDKLGVLPIDFGYTVGRQPLFYENGTLINDSVTMVGLARNSIHLPFTSNVLIDAVYAWDHIRRPGRPTTVVGQQPALEGLTATIDALRTTYEVEMLHVDDARKFGSGWYIGGAAIQRFGLFNTAFRVNSSIANGKQTAVSTNGTLISLETSFNPFRSEDLVYFNPYAALGNFTQAAKDPVVPGPLGGLGITFAAYGIGTAVAPLSSAANRVVGFTTGYQAFWDAKRQSLTLEFGVRENTGTNGTFNAQAFGARYQQAIGQRVLWEVDASVTRQENHNKAFGVRTEIDYQF